MCTPILPADRLLAVCTLPELRGSETIGDTVGTPTDQTNEGTWRHTVQSACIHSTCSILSVCLHLHRSSTACGKFDDEIGNCYLQCMTFWTACQGGWWYRNRCEIDSRVGYHILSTWHQQAELSSAQLDGAGKLGGKGNRKSAACIHSWRIDSFSCDANVCSIVFFLSFLPRLLPAFPFSSFHPIRFCSWYSSLYTASMAGSREEEIDGEKSQARRLDWSGTLSTLLPPVYTLPIPLSLCLSPHSISPLQRFYACTKCRTFQAR